MRLWYLLYKVLTETTSAQPIVSSYPQSNSMLYPRGIDCNKDQYIVNILYNYHMLSLSI